MNLNFPIFESCSIMYRSSNGAASAYPPTAFSAECLIKYPLECGCQKVEICRCQSPGH